MTPLQATVIGTPYGDLALVVDRDAVGDLGPTRYGAVVASGFTSVDDQVSRLTDGQRARGVDREAALPDVTAAVEAYVAGDLGALDRVSVRQPGGPFLQAAWAALRGVPAGETTSYAGLADRAGRPRAVRAAGSACARNLVAPFVPCHRVVRSDGTLGGYYYGLDVKRALLDHEAAAAGPAST
jgi:methylated-DNA-[protein]-cysteine S-methyltransferase